MILQKIPENENYIFVTMVDKGIYFKSFKFKSTTVFDLVCSF